MPKVKINYAEMLFYKISCLCPNITKVFIGHTTNVNQRKHILKKQTQSEIYYSDMIEFIKNSGGWENWILQILEKYECKTHIDIVLREMHHSEMFNKKTSVVLNEDKLFAPVPPRATGTTPVIFSASTLFANCA